MRIYTGICIALVVFFSTTSGFAQNVTSVGSDTFVSGSSPMVSAKYAKDVFVRGFSPSVSAQVSGDLHVVGFDITISGSVAEDFYAAGTSVAIGSTIAEDATVSGFKVILNEQAKVAGNVRIAAGTATINSPVQGSLVASAGELKINSIIAGDVLLAAKSIQFGEKARIDGNLVYSSGDDVSIPESVIAANRVQRVPFDRNEVIKDVRDTIDTAIPSFWPSVFSRITGFLLTMGFLVLVAALLLAYQPDRVASFQQFIRNHPAKSILAGVLGLSTLIGLIPVSAMTIIGIPLIPFVMLLILILWLFGYLLGAYVISRKLYASFIEAPLSSIGELCVLAVGLLVLALLNFIPVLGWLLNLIVMLMGLGAISSLVARRLNENTSTSFT